jgi:modification methylase
MSDLRRDPGGPGRVPVAGGSVWPTGQVDLPTQLSAGGYLPGTAADAAGLPPAVAAHAIGAFTRAGDVVLDPDCGAGTVLVEAVRAGRHAVGVTGRRWWPTARANLSAAKLAGATADGMVLDRRPDRPPPADRTGAPPAGPAGLIGLTGRVDLVLTAARLRWQQAGPALDALADLLDRSALLLRPGGHAVVVAGPTRRGGRLLDLPDILTRAARRAGLVPVERCVALTAPAPDQHPVGRRLPARTTGTGRAGRQLGVRPVARAGHLDVYVFARPPRTEAANTTALPLPAAVLPAIGRWAA